MKNFNIKALATLTAITMAGVFSACGDNGPTQGAGVSIDEDGIIADNNISSDSQEPSSSESGPLGSSDSQLPSISSSSMYTQDNPPVSSSSVIMFSSSSSFVFSSSSQAPVLCKAANAWGGCGKGIDGDYVWEGYDEVYMVETGLDNGSETGGTWFEFNDIQQGGGSTIKWPVDKGNSYDEESFDPVIDFCDGICGEISFDKGSLDFSPFAGIAFSIAGKKEDGTLEPADISNWENICIMYESQVAFTMELGVTDSLSKALKFDRPKVSLPRNGGNKCFNFSDFKQTGYGEEMAIDEVLKQVTSIEFMFSQPTSSTKTATFYIQAIAIGLKE